MSRRTQKEDFRDEDPVLSGLLRAGRPQAALGPGFEAAVWRRIARRERARGAWMERLVQGMGRAMRPRWMVTGLAAVVVVGGLLGGLAGRSAAHELARERYLTSVAPNLIW